MGGGDNSVSDMLNGWVQLGLVGGILFGFWVSLNRGWLWTGGSVKLVIDQMEKRISDRDMLISELRTTNQAHNTRNDLLADQVRQLVQVGITSNAALTALPQVGVKD